MNGPNAVIVFPMLEHMHTCPVCKKVLSVNSTNFYLYENGNLVSLKCKPCYKQWRIDLRKNQKGNIILRLKKKSGRITKFVRSLISTDSEDIREIQEQIEKTLKSEGWIYLGQGASRIVYGKGYYALKLEYNGKWDWKDEEERRSQTQIEIDNYENVVKELPKEGQSIFLPILAYGKNWSLVPKVDMRNTTEKDIHYVKRIMSKHHIHIGDIRFNNVGLLKGKPYIVDYGVDDIRKED